MKRLTKYNNKRNFKKSNEPIGKIAKNKKKEIFVIQHHLARKDHYDFRLEFNNVLISWAIPKGPSYNPKDKRLAIHVEDHPYEYRNFEGIIPKGEYGAGVVQIWDEGYYEPIEDFKKTLKKGYLKFRLKGKRLKGLWSLIQFKDVHWLLIKENDGINEFNDITKIQTSIKTNRTISEIENSDKIEITNPNKIMYKNSKITKQDIVNYYEKVSQRMLPYLSNRILSVVRCPNENKANAFFKKHLETSNKYINKIDLKNKNGKKEDYYYLTNTKGLISEAQMNTIEFHVGGSKIDNLDNPDIMVFDLDPDESLDIKKVRTGVKDLKSILDDFNLKSYLKTSGGKGYHVLVHFKNRISWEEFTQIAQNIAKLMEARWPDRYTSNIRKEKRKNKIFIDWIRNTKGASSIAPYSLRAKDKPVVSMPIKWNELDKIEPNEIDLKNAIKRLKRKDPWEDFFE